MKPSNPGVLAGLAVVVAVITWAVLQPAYTSLPALPWTAIPTFLLLAVAEFVSGRGTRARIERRPGARPVEPLAVARLAVLAKASAYAGAVFAGIFAGYFFHTVGMFDVPHPRQDAFVSGGSFIAAVVLVAAALFLEFNCRAPKTDDGVKP